jgi:DNA-binding XRE family transcriptional regulator
VAKTLDDVIAGLPLDQQQEVAAQAARLIEEELTLRDLRKAHELTQERMAEALHITQDGVSRIEKRSDFLISTLRSYIEARSRAGHAVETRRSRHARKAGAARSKDEGRTGLRSTVAPLACYRNTGAAAHPASRSRTASSRSNR